MGVFYVFKIVQMVPNPATHHILNLINNGYKNILVRTVDTNVLVLMISYIRQLELNDIEIHAYPINSDRYCTSNRSYLNLVLIFFLLYASFMLSLGVILFPFFMVKVSVKQCCLG